MSMANADNKQNSLSLRKMLTASQQKLTKTTPQTINTFRLCLIFRKLQSVAENHNQF